MPRFLHTSDFHLNALRRFSKHYLQRAKDTLHSILQLAHAQQVDFILVVGDIYDRRDITHLERQLFSDWVASSDIPIVIISGNHDKRSDAVGDTCLSYLSSLRQIFRQHTIYDGVPTVLTRFGCHLILIPYQGWMDQELFLILDTLVPRARQLDASLPIIVAMHEAVYGCKNDVGLTITASNQIRLDDSFPQVTYWALGDMHICQQITETAWYSGAPHQTRFDEIREKGVLIVDTASSDSPEFVPVPSIPLLICEREPPRWPAADEAFVQFRPADRYQTAVLPANVEFHPTILTRQPTAEDASDRRIVGIFDGLDAALRRAGLREELFPLAWRLAVKMAKTEGIDIPLPEDYRTLQEHDNG